MESLAQSLNAGAIAPEAADRSPSGESFGIGEILERSFCNGHQVIKEQNWLA